MGFLQCGHPLWHWDDFSECVRVDVFQILLPLIPVAISLAWMLISISHSVIMKRKLHSYRRLPTTQSEVHGEETDEDDEFAEHLSLRHTRSRLTEPDVIVDRPRTEVLAVVAEALGVMGIIGTFITSVVMEAEHQENWISVVEAIPWIYTLALVLLRTFHVNIGNGLWDHTALIYVTMFVVGAIPLRSYILHPPSASAETLMIVRYALITVLCTITVTVRKGNSAIVQELSEGLEPAREPTASLLSLASFGWLDEMIWKGYWKPLEIQEIWNLRNDDLAVAVLTSFRQTKKTASLAWTLGKHFKRDLIIQALWASFASLFVFAPTLLLRVILEYVKAPETIPRSVAWLFVALMFITSSVVAIANGQALFIGRRICIRLRAVIIGEVYAKALRRKAAAGNEKTLGAEPKKLAEGEKDDSQTNVGAIINLMAVDSFKVSEVCAYLHFLIAAVPVEIIIAVTLLYQILGWSAIAGISVMVLLLPVNYFISNRFNKIQKEIMAQTDKRIHSTNEVLQNIRIIKFFAWEERFGHIVNETRSAELRQLRKRYMLWAVAATSWYGSPMLITFLSFLCYTVIEKKELDSPIAFTALSLFNVLRVPLDQLADMITNVLQTKVSVDRVEEFLNEEETEKYHQLKHDEVDPDAPIIGFRNASLTWGSKQQAETTGTASAFQLQDLNINFVPGELNVIAGSTGSGKTSLLMGLLGEMTHLKGKVYLPGIHSREDLAPHPDTGLTESVAYCAQQPWLVNDTIKGNIVFASDFNETRYKQVLAACALERDLEILDHGDETEVGEKGISLSGGQKQRISLARALYSKSAHLLLDDCLSAVDSHTAKWIHQFCLTGPLMQGRTCILVTHNVALCVPDAKKVIVMKNGRVVAQGDPETVLSSGALGEDELLKSGMKSRAESTVPSRVPSSEDVSAETITNGHADTIKPVNGEAKKEKISKEETKTEGSVSWRVYRLFLASMGPWYYWVMVVLIFVSQQIGSVATSLWVREWARAYDTPNQGNGTAVMSLRASHSTDGAISGSCHASGTCLWAWPMSPVEPMFDIQQDKPQVNLWYYLGVYMLIGLAYVFVSFLREVTVFTGSLKASQTIHQKLLFNIMRAKIRFFDSTPLGRIMNRFSKDMEAIDQEVAPVALGMMHSLGAVIVIVILISFITPGFLLPGIFISCLYWFIGMFYLAASRDLKRIESIQRSPLYQHFGETLNGVSTIRAYGDERRFVRDNLAKIDAHNRPFFYLWASNRWLGFRVDIVGALVSFFAGVFVVMNVGKIDAASAGLSLVYAITFTDNVLWVVRLYAMNEQNMNSVERIREYLDVEQEAPDVIPENRPETSWPDKGGVVFENYSTRYRPDLDQVLKNVSFEIKPGQKVGIVGRTGAGKSSLTLALFRSLEADSGKIFIDGIDIATIGLRDLRQSITMVPQDPTLFTGTIRSNLDPFGIHTDAEIFAALKRVQLISAEPEPAAPVAGDDATVNKNIFLDLQSPVSESGGNLSQGQRQLVCLARALLRSPKVLIMDEATGSLDYQTDQKIQDTVGLMDGTIIVIAHRLRSVAGYSKIVVLDHGELAETGHPHELLQNESGIFYGMCESSGELETLKAKAKAAWDAEKVLVDVVDQQNGDDS